MSGDLDPPTVDFVVGDSSGSAHNAADLDVIDTTTRPGARRRWRRPAAYLGALAALVVVGAVHARQSGGPSTAVTGARRSSPSASTEASRTASVAGTLSAPESPADFPPDGAQHPDGAASGGEGRQVSVEVPVERSMPPCPQADDGQSACVTSHSMPAAFVAAVRGRFPRARQVSALDVQLRDSGPASSPGVWSRHYVARTGPFSITVTVEALEVAYPLGAGGKDDGSRSVVFSERSVGHSVVEVVVAGPSGARGPSLTRVDSLAGDPRLTQI